MTPLAFVIIVAAAVQLALAVLDRRLRRAYLAALAAERVQLVTDLCEAVELMAAANQVPHGDELPPELWARLWALRDECHRRLA